MAVPPGPLGSPDSPDSTPTEPSPAVASGGPADAGLPQIRGHHPALDGVRAVAALLVLVFHVAVETGAALAPGFWGGVLARGEIGVPLFFALSGLLLYRPWARAALAAGPGPHTAGYLWRRALRVLPAYWLVVAAAMLLWSREWLDDPLTWLTLLTLTFTYDLDPWWYGLGPQGLGQMWSLAVEASYYLLLPLIAAALTWYAARGGASVAARGRRLLTGLGVLSAVSLAAVAVQFFAFAEPLTEMYAWLPRTLVLFAVGMLLAVLSEWAWLERGAADGADGPVRRFCRTIGATAGICWLIALGAYLIGATPLTGPRFVGVDSFWTGVFETVTSTAVAFFFVAPLALGAPGRGWAWRLLAHPVMRYLGRISYGVFLWQFVVLYGWRAFTGDEPFTGSLLFDLVPVAAGTIVLAHLTYRWVEEPLRRRYAHRGPGARRGPAPERTGRAGVTPPG
ncbi:acyltransferase family protein [Allonocardiopsis opalescens]|uniref:Peptidoglycan/LPS O-acetylase OafA/YrhL n=1 Tax=Allonocardiopsis opalescens TaxID=1144618 RepID=A0A2T0QCL6_9ACTN|nr:acyltransferase [Allonocardiopsis opalescens]PRY01593.1 peptidoglycan/LPS O-acetylase OafA/YrhL [Allonocardiopsis opalescens]